MASTAIHIPNRRTITILADTKRQAETTVEALRYGQYLTDTCTVEVKRDKGAQLVVATITLSYALDNATITKLRTF